MKSNYQPIPNMPIRVVSFDFDGCLFNERFEKRKSPKFKMVFPEDPTERAAYHREMSEALFAANEAFFTDLATSTAKAGIKQVSMMVGSNRQDCNTDQTNLILNKTDSCFSALLGLREILASKWPDIDWKVDRYLLADTYGNKRAGESFDLSIQDETGILKAQHAKQVFDNSKLSLLLMQALKVGTDHPGEKVCLDFFDDHEGVLGDLLNFFQENPVLLPANVILRLKHYNGKQEPRLCGEIQGANNRLERDHQALLFRMLACAGVDRAEAKHCNLIHLFRAFPERWQRFIKPQPEAALVEVIAEHAELNELKEYIQGISVSTHEDDRPVAHDFVKSLVDAHRTFANELTTMNEGGWSDKKIQASHAMESVRTLTAFTKTFGLREPGVDPLAAIEAYAKKINSDYRLRRFKKILIAVVVTAAAFVLGAAIGFGVGLGVGLLTGPGAIATSAAGAVAGATLGVAIGASVGATLFGATGGLVSRYVVNKQFKRDENVDQAVLGVATCGRALKAN